MTGSALTMTSPSSSRIRRSTPCVDGCCGPMLRVISSVANVPRCSTTRSRPPPRTIHWSAVELKTARSSVSIRAYCARPRTAPPMGAVRGAALLRELLADHLDPGAPSQERQPHQHQPDRDLRLHLGPPRVSSLRSYPPRPAVSHQDTGEHAKCRSPRARGLPAVAGREPNTKHVRRSNGGSGAPRPLHRVAHRTNPVGALPELRDHGSYGAHPLRSRARPGIRRRAA